MSLYFNKELFNLLFHLQQWHLWQKLHRNKEVFRLFYPLLGSSFGAEAKSCAETRVSHRICVSATKKNSQSAEIPPVASADGLAGA